MLKLGIDHFIISPKCHFVFNIRNQQNSIDKYIPFYLANVIIKNSENFDLSILTQTYRW